MRRARTRKRDFSWFLLSSVLPLPWIVALRVGAIPLAFAISSGGWSGLPLDARQTEELLLTSEQSLLATVMICDWSFSRREALALAALFLVQLGLPGTEVRLVVGAVYVVLAGFLVVADPRRRRALGMLLRVPGAAPGAARGS